MSKISNRSKEKVNFIKILVALFISAVALAYTSYRHVNLKESIISNALENTTKAIIGPSENEIVSLLEKDDRPEKIEEISKELGSLNCLNVILKRYNDKTEKYVKELALSLDRENPEYDNLVVRMKKTLKACNLLSGIGTYFSEVNDVNKLEAHFTKYKCIENKNLYAPFFKKSMIQDMQFPYDYTRRDHPSYYTNWYSESIKEGSWVAPYFGFANDKLVLSYRWPFGWDEATQRNRGNVCADYSLEFLRDMVADLNLFESGYGIIINDKGTILSHPVRKYLNSNIISPEIEGGRLSLKKIQDLKKGIFHDFSDILEDTPVSKERERLVFCKEVGGHGWNIIVIINKDEILSGLVLARQDVELNYYLTVLRMKIILSTLSALLVFIISLLFFKVYKDGFRNYWWLVVSFSICCVFTIFSIWYFHLQSPSVSDGKNIEISSITATEASLNTFKRINSENFDKIRIKTGFYIQSVKFSNSNTVNVIGYVWQKFPQELYDTSPDFQTPDFNSSQVLKLTLPEAESIDYEIEYSDKNITRWSFNATLRQAFDYTKYPFDEENIWIRICYKDFYDNKFILVPDFDSYPKFPYFSTNGLACDIFLEGWDIERSYFSYRINSYSSNFGTGVGEQSLAMVPELYFNLAIHRQIMGAPVSYLIPLIVVAFLLFTVLMIAPKDKDKNELLGFSSANVLAYCASLFFVLIISHMSLREALFAKRIIYLEYFYFTLYFALAIVSTSSITFVYRKANIANREYEGLLIKLFYWPFILLIFLIITAIRFSFQS